LKKTFIASALLTLCATGAQVQAQQLFQPPLQFLTDQQTTGVAIGDLNGDGRKDVAVSACGCGFSVPSKLYIYTQLADRTLSPTPVEYLLSGGGGSTEIGDVTGDGRADVVVRAGFGIEVFAQTAAGTLAPSTFYLSNYAEALRVGDLNGDGRLDAIGLELSVDGHTNTEEAGIWYQNPAGSFDPQVLVPLPHGFSDDAELADLNNDGRADIVVVNPFNEPAIVILYQNADGTMSAPVSLSIGPGVLSYQVGVGDIDNNGRKDIVASYGGYTTDVHLALFRQNADGSFAAPVLVNAADWLTAVEVADANSDGRQDVLLLHQTSLGVMLQNADGTLAAETLIALPPAGGHPQQGFRAADINGDGATDIAYATVGAQGSLTVLYGAVLPPPVNRPPVAVADRASLVCDGAVVISVLANDSDPDGDALKIVGVSRPANGTAKPTADGKRIRYEPRRRFRGTDQFTYTISDGHGGTASAIVKVTVR
jgi:Bacterial Ig domain/FG-GAP-like repeat